MLSDFSTPSLPFGLTEVHQQDDEVVESHRMLPQGLNDRLRGQAKRFGVNLASLCHLAWALVISRTSGEDRVVFGTVLFGRMGSGPGVDSAMGLFINALPLRIDLDGTVLETVLQTHERLASLLEYEYASLALAQRCSGIPSGIPLFNSLLNYRHNAQLQEETWDEPGIKFMESHERTNYPFNMSIEDFGTSLGVTALMTKSVDGVRVCGYLQQAMESLVQALEHFPETSLQQLEVLPVEEKELLTKRWNTTQKEYLDRQCVHQLFEHQVTLRQEAEALVFMDKVMTYSELNARANRIAHRLIELGVKPDTPVVVCVERSLAMVISVLAVLKAGGAYVPLDPSYPKERLAYVLGDIMPNVVLADATGRDALRDAGETTSQKGREH
jgi:non-ribosomal peptide synthetase component F